MNYYGNRHNEEFIFTRVSWEGFNERENYNYITSGTIEYAVDSALKVTGKFDFEGYDLPNPNDLIRVYYRFTNGGESVKHALATFFVSLPVIDYQDTIHGIKASGSMNAESVLSVLNNKKLGRPFTVSRSSHVLKIVQDLISECGLPIKLHESSSFQMTSDYTFKSTESYLTTINYLLSLASYKDAYPDEYGYIHLVPLNEEGNNLIFANDDNSIMYPQLSNENNWQTTPNVVKLVFNTDEYYMIGTASNLDGSRASLSNRGGRETTYVEEISNVGEGTRSLLLKQKAEEILKEKSTDLEYVKFEHCWIPMNLYDSVTINYSDRSWTGILDNFSIELSPSIKTTSKIKKSLVQDIVIDSSCTVYRGEETE